jgi:hypothetical protein
MEKLNFDKMKGISFPGADNLYISTVQLFSWAKILEADALLSQTKEYIRKWYLDKDGLEDVLNEIGTLWDTLKDTVAESNLQDFLDRGCLEFHKDMFKERYDNYGQPFADGLRPLTDFFIDTTFDEAQKKAYREYRKENRPQTIGIGFGITGGLKAAMSSGLGNMATGAAHGIFNAIANGIGDIQKNNRLYEFYNQKSTLNSIIEGWSETFWLIYDDQIDIINSRLVETDTPLVYKFKEFINLKRNAAIKFENLQKASNTISDEEYLETNLQCIWAFPFEGDYWKAFYMIPFLSGMAKSDTYDNMVDFFKKINECINNFYSDEFATELVLILINLYIQEEQNVKECIFSILKEKITDDDFEVLFDNAIEDKIADKNVSSDYIKQLLILIKRLDYDIAKYERDDEFKKEYDTKKMIIALEYVKQNESQIISELEKSQFDTILKDATNDPALDNDKILASIIYVINEKIQNSKNISYTPNLLINIEKLKAELKLGRDLNTLPNFVSLKSRLTPVENKMQLFNCFIQGIIDAHSPNILGKRVYWGKIPHEKETMLRENIGGKENEKLFFAIDDTISQSGKIGVVFTTNGLYGRVKDRPRFFLPWNDLVDKHKISLYDSSFFIDSIGEERKFIVEIKFSGISSHLMANLIAGAGNVFTNKIIKINDFSPIDGAEFDILKLEKKSSDDQKAEPKQKEDNYNFLKENDRIFKAVKFKERKGFFKHILPSSWFVTILFYGFLYIIGLIFNEIIASILFLPLLVFGIIKRIKYIKEKKCWKDCTNKGEKDIKDVFKEFQEMQNNYTNNNGHL